MLNYNKLILLIFFIFLTNHKLQAQDYGSISTSRPGMSNPTASIPFGLYQFEIGTNISTSPGLDTLFSIPMLIRMGIYKNSELQVTYSNNYLTLGILYGGINFIKKLESSIIISASFTENNDSLTEYNTYLPFSYSFNNGFSIWGQTSATFFSNKIIENKDPILSYAIAIGNSINNNSNWFFEVYQPFIKDQDDTPISFDYGLTYLTNDNVQFDISMGMTLNKLNNKYRESYRFIEWGFSFRLPK